MNGLGLVVVHACVVDAWLGMEAVLVVVVNGVGDVLQARWSLVVVVWEKEGDWGEPKTETRI